MGPHDSLCIQRLAEIPFKKIEGGFKLKNNFQEMGYISSKPKKGGVDEWNLCSNYNSRNYQIHNPGGCNCRIFECEADLTKPQ